MINQMRMVWLMRLTVLTSATIVSLLVSPTPAMACTVTEDGRILGEQDPDPGGRLYPGVSNADCAEIKRVGIAQWQANEQARRASIDEQNEIFLKRSRAAATIKDATDDAAAAKSEKGQTEETVCLGIEEAWSERLLRNGTRFHMLGVQPMWCQNGDAAFEPCVHTTRTSFNLPVARPAGRWHLACVASIIYLDVQYHQEHEASHEVSMSSFSIKNHQVKILY